jgi:superoxide dismutase
MAVYALPDLPYDYAALEPAMTGEIVELHHAKLHAAYVKGANDTLEQLAELGESASPVMTVGLEKTLAFNLSGHVLHSIFWTAGTGRTGSWPPRSPSTSAPSRRSAGGCPPPRPTCRGRAGACWDSSRYRDG